MLSMKRGAALVAPVLFMFFGSLRTSGHAQAPKPNFSGNWKLDAGKSDDAAKKIHEGMVDATGKTGPTERQRVLERLIQLARAMDYLEIKHNETELQFIDDAANVRIYYIDGKKHPRQTPWGAKLQTVTIWEADHLLVKTDGKDLGQVEELYAFQGRELVYEIRVRPAGLKNEIVARSFYSRLQSQ